MKKKFRLAAEKHLKQLQRRRNWRKVVRAMACVVVFCTTYALILPAITMERDECTLTEHVHSESCYEKVLTETVKVLNCNYDSLGVHVHEADCLDAEGILICGEADYLVHTHSGECYDAEGSLVCGLPEVEEHEHTEDCYGIVETEPAETEATEPILPEDGEGDAEAETTEPAMPEDGEEDTVAVRELICDKEVIVLHSHDEEDCYETYLDEEGNEQKRLICTQVIVLEHNHDESCFVTEEVLVEDADALTCPLAEGHVHAEACYDETGTLICEEVENHTHGDMCYGTWTLICGQEEHTHDEGCVFPEEMEPNTLRYRGKDYEVTVRYEDSAEIPENAQLTVRELSGEEYREHLQRVYDEIGAEGTNTLIQMETEEDPNGYSDENVAAVSGEIGFARFFDITILADGQEIQPKSPVEVSIIFDESVKMPDGEKAAVHFNHDGTVEILEVGDDSAEEEPQDAIGYILQNTGKNRQSETEENRNVFVFRQDSFSVSAAIYLESKWHYDNTVSINWPAESDISKAITIYVRFYEPNSPKSITVNVPTGFRIEGYSSLEGPGVSQDKSLEFIEIDNLYSGDVNGASLLAANNQAGIVGVVTNPAPATWFDQKISGYSGDMVSGEKDIRTYGGVVTWNLKPTTRTMKLVLNLSVQKELLRHTVKEENMGDIVITVKGDETKITKIKTKVTDIPQVSIKYVDGLPEGMDMYYAAERSDFTNRSDLLPVCFTIKNFHGGTGEDIAYAEKAEFILKYPKDVYLEPDTLYCGMLGFTDPGDIEKELAKQNKTLQKNGTTKVNNHLSVTWYEGRSGDEFNTIKWTLTKFTMRNYWNGGCMGASFRADNGKYNIASDTHVITGFSAEMSYYQRNGDTTRKSGPINFTRQLVDGDKKNIQITGRNFMRRNITRDFGLEGYDYVLGGFNVYSMLAYTDNVFYFTNPYGLEITALNLMGKNIRDIYVYTNYRRSSPINVLADYPGYFKTVGSMKVYDEAKVYERTWGGSNSVSGESNHGALLELSKIGGQEGEYITACFFVADTDQTTYVANYTFSGFTYIGKFDEKQLSGKPVYLQQLVDGATYQSALEGEDFYEKHRNQLAYENKAIIGPNAYVVNYVIDDDQTTIGWTNTGVSAVVTTAKDQNGQAGNTFYPNSVIAIETEIHSGFRNAVTSQNVLIDPVVVINLPKGISLDLQSAVLQRPEVSYSDYWTGGMFTMETVPSKVEKLGTTMVDNVEWTTYIISYNGPAKDMVAWERLFTSESLQINRFIAKVNLIVSPQCPNYDLSLKDLVMWDVRNDAGANVNLSNVEEPSENGDAIDSHWDNQTVREDTHNFLGNGSHYAVGNNGGTIHIKPLIGFVMDLGIKAVDNLNDPESTSGFTTYDGQDSSIVRVRSGGYADVKLSYFSNSESNYFTGSAIYVPIPKYEKDFGSSAGSYFQNINLTSPLTQTDFRNFEYTMDLTRSVTLVGEPDVDGNRTQWTTYYAVDFENLGFDFYVDQNKDPYKAPAAGAVDDWEPVRRYAEQNDYKYRVEWLTEEELRAQGWDYADVRMVKFEVKEGSTIPPAGSGSVIMRLYVHNVDETDPGLYGKVNYWRAYGKAVDELTFRTGPWDYTSVVAATPGKETVEGQFFVDKDSDGIFSYIKDSNYIGKNFAVELYDSTGKKWDDGFLNVDKSGYFALQDSMGRRVYLPKGTYTIKIHDNDLDFAFDNSNEQGTIGIESPSTAWRNNVEGVDGGTATFTFTVGNGPIVHRIGIGLAPEANVTIIGKKSIAGGHKPEDGEFTFVLRDSNGNILKDKDGNDITATNDGDGNFAFPPIEYKAPGTHNYLVTEVKGDSTLMTYDNFVHKVQVSIGWTSDGRLVSTVRYDNTASAYDRDRQEKDWAAFTNSVANAILEGQIFVDSDQDGLFESGEKPYRGETRGKMKVTVSGPGLSDVPVTVNEDGSFALLDSEDKYVDLAPGTYTVTIKETDADFGYASSSYVDNGFGGSIGEESPATAWHNNVSGDFALGGTSTTTWTFTVTESSSGTQIHRVGIALKSSANIQLKAQKTFTGGILNGRDFLFRLEPIDGAPIGDPRGYAEAWNQSNGEVFLDNRISYTKPGTYRYRITEVTDTPPKSGVIYDTHVTIATVIVAEDNYDGVLSVSVVYDNSTGRTQEDRDDKTVARFTNSISYELPATGGAGTTSYTMGGLLMVTAAILLYIYTPKRRKEDHASF